MSDMRAVFPIDRDALQDAVFGYLAEMGVDEWDLVQPIRRMIQDAPTLDYEPVRRGEWDWDTLDVYMCSCCGEKAHVKEVMGKPAWDFCPNCGAKMEEDGKDV